MLFIFGAMLVTIFGMISEPIKYKWVLWLGLFLEILAVGLSFFADNIDKLFGDKIK